MDDLLCLRLKRWNNNNLFDGEVQGAIKSSIYKDRIGGLVGANEPETARVEANGVNIRLIRPAPNVSQEIYGTDTAGFRVSSLEN
jgi:hypothetical protein